MPININQKAIIYPITDVVLALERKAWKKYAKPIWANPQTNKVTKINKKLVSRNKLRLNTKEPKIKKNTIVIAYTI